MLEAYRALLRKIDEAASAVAARRSGSLACRAGCDACCHVSLTVSAVEAEAVRAHLATLSSDARDRIAARARVAPVEPRCVMLDDDGRCAIYDARPAVCRTQGHALRYPAGTVPAAALVARAREGDDVVWCPLNYRDAPPEPRDVLDAERVDVLLAVVNARFADESGAEREVRVALRDLALTTPGARGTVGRP